MVAENYGKDSREFCVARFRTVRAMRICTAPFTSAGSMRAICLRGPKMFRSERDPQAMKGRVPGRLRVLLLSIMESHFRTARPV